MDPYTIAPIPSYSGVGAEQHAYSDNTLIQSIRVGLSIVARYYAFHMAIMILRV